LSYFIGDGQYEQYEANDRKSFQKMYGNSSEFIDPTSVLDVAKTLNKRFMEKN